MNKREEEFRKSCVLRSSGLREYSPYEGNKMELKIKALEKRLENLKEAVEEIKTHQEIVLPSDDRMRKLSTTWRLCNKALDRDKEMENE